MTALRAIRTIQDVCDADFTTTKGDGLRKHFTVDDMEFAGVIAEHGDNAGIVTLIDLETGEEVKYE